MLLCLVSELDVAKIHYQWFVDDSKPIQRHSGINKTTCKPIYHRKKKIHIIILYIYNLLPSGAIVSCNKVVTSLSKNLTEGRMIQYYY